MSTDRDRGKWDRGKRNDRASKDPATPWHRLKAQRRAYHKAWVRKGKPGSAVKAKIDQSNVRWADQFIESFSDES